LKWTN